MNQRKRPQEFTTTTSKRPRSVLEIKRNAAWGRVAGRSLLQTFDDDVLGVREASADPILEEAVAALLEIGGRGRLAKAYFDLRELKKDATRLLRAPERPALFKSSSLDVIEQERTCALSKDALGQQPSSPRERLPASSSVSDGSTTAEASEPPELPSARTSLDSETLSPGSGPQRILRQAFVQLATKGQLDATAGSPTGGQCSPKAVPSPWSANSTASVLILPPDGRNVVSTGMPPLLPKAHEEIARATKVAAIAGKQEQQMHPVASFSGGKLIVIAAAPPRKLAEAELQRAATAPVPGKIVVHRPQAGGAPVTPSAASPLLGRTVSAAVGTDKPLWHFSATSKAVPGGSSSSGDESCDELYKPTWGLDLFSALNPSVITTGHCSFRDSL